MHRTALIDTAAFAEHALAGLSSGVVAIDMTGRMLFANRAAARVLELAKPESLAGRPCQEALASSPDVARLLLEALDSESPPTRAELELRHRRTGGRTIGYTLSHVRASSGELIGAMMIFKDLTRIERLEEQARLKDRLAVLGQLAAALAHEMRNPVASIEIHAGLLQRALEDAEPGRRDSIAQILAEARQLSETITTCLDFVRPVEAAENPVALEPILDAVAAEAGPGAVCVSRDFASGGTVVLGDAAKLRQAFSNLVRNAREAAGPNGRVWIRSRYEGTPIRLTEGAAGRSDAGGDVDDDREVVVEVEDTGPGIAPEQRDRVFQPFFTTKPKGSGLGLALVQKIIQSHRGRIDFADRPGGGTVFRVILRPAAGEPA